MADKKQSLLSWRIDKEELGKQVSQYFQLKPHQSFRGISTIILSLGLLAGTVVSIFLSLPTIDILFGIAIGLILIYFVYRGHRWAMIVSILVFTANILLSSFNRLVDGTFSATSLILIGIAWLVVVGYLIKAIRIENHRRKEKYNIKPKIKEGQPPQRHLSLKNLFTKENRKNSILTIGFVVFVSVSVFVYSNYSISKEKRLSCLQSITYVSSRYFVEDSSGSRIKNPNGSTAISKTKDDAMEYCLIFLQTVEKELSFADKIKQIDKEKTSFTLEEIRKMQNK